MLRFFQRLQHRETVRGNLNALLLMYPRKRQFERDFSNLRATIRRHFEDGVAPPSSALQIATGIIEGFIGQLSGDERLAVAATLAAGDLKEIELLAERRIGGEKDQRGDKVFFATRLAGVALLMSGRMSGVGAIRRGEFDHLVAAIEQALGVEDGKIARAFAPAALPVDPPK